MLLLLLHALLPLHVESKPRCRCDAPSVRRALPPVGTHSTVLQLGHTTTVWLWLNTVVLQQARWVGESAAGTR